MNKTFFALSTLSLLIANAQAQAATHGTFVIGGRAIFTIQNPSAGPADNDARVLYEAMNVKPKDSFVGPGKAIVTESKDFSLTCAIRNGGIYSCSFILQQSDRSKLDAIHERAEFTLHGSAAREMSSLFVKGNDGRFSYETTERKLQVSGTDEEFRFSYK